MLVETSKSHSFTAMALRTLFVIIMTVCLTDGARILGIFPYQGKSHNVMFEPLMIGLAKAGHTVDLVSHFPLKKPVPGLNHISLKGSLHFYVNNVTASSARGYNGIYGMVHSVSVKSALDLCNLMRLPQLQNIINTDTKYDIMVTQVFGSNCYLAVAHKLKIPVVGVVTSVIYPWSYGPFFGDANPSFIPSQLGTFTNEMSFVERVQNTIEHYYAKFLFHYYDRTVSDPLAKKYFDDLPLLNDLYNNMSLLLVNSHLSIHGVRPRNPAIVEVGGLHIDTTQVLSEELEKYLNSSKDGVVYFCMGTMVRSDTFAQEKILAIYESFSALSNYNILWKSNAEDLPKPFPSNVKVIPWAPQYAVLNHPKVKAFVTHGGLMGTLEAVHAGVPMIGIPFFGDQAFNVLGYVHRGFAVHIDYDDINQLTFSKALNEVLTNPMYQSNAARYSRLFKDRPLSPLDEAVFWIEYIIRNGGEPLRSSALHLYWFQYYLIDVILFLLAVPTLFLLSLFHVLKRVLRTNKGTKTRTIQKKKKTS
ncbi:UDP-glucosyltransferase 2-like isoform X1 [Neodiprion fabricii]|uniref:UDP-glucosyltransferase 2-like isoform X1 n=2 Tax=Neodiprion fabricii TaxID=2872261 RepID=UPI001ED94B5D|nr:UDP-glucosyltransferase 2-like isoform X1 [Neodiprion fabricii]